MGDQLPLATALALWSLALFHPPFECAHFVECVETRQTPRTDGRNGIRVLRVLQAAQRSLQTNGQPVSVTQQRLETAAM